METKTETAADQFKIITSRSAPSAQTKKSYAKRKNWNFYWQNWMHKDLYHFIVFGSSSSLFKWKVFHVHGVLQLFFIR